MTTQELLARIAALPALKPIGITGALQARLDLLLAVNREFLETSSKLYLKDGVIVSDKALALACLKIATEKLS